MALLLPAEVNCLLGQRNPHLARGLVILPEVEDDEHDDSRGQIAWDAAVRSGLKEPGSTEKALVLLQNKSSKGYTTTLEDLPTEILDYIISFFDIEPPSVRNRSEEPSLDLTVSGTKYLKHISLTSPLLRRVSLPRLFRYSRVKAICSEFLSGETLTSGSFFIDNVDAFIGFLRSKKLLEYVKGLVVYINEIPLGTLKEQSTLRKTRIIWRQIFPHINPRSVIVIGSPLYLARLISCDLSNSDAWAFDMPLHILRLEQPACFSMPRRTTYEGLLDARPWTNLSLNEGSSLQVYQSYEYYLKTTPSVLGIRPMESISRPLLAMKDLTSLYYTAIFPFYTHTDDVLKYAKTIPSLEKLSLQLIPTLQSNMLDDPVRRAHVHLEDCWLEVDTGYSLVVHAVMEMGENGRLKEFESRDYAIKSMQEILEGKASETMRGWRWCGKGIWRKDDLFLGSSLVNQRSSEPGEWG